MSPNTRTSRALMSSSAATMALPAQHARRIRVALVQHVPALGEDEEVGLRQITSTQLDQARPPAGHSHHGNAGLADLAEHRDRVVGHRFVAAYERSVEIGRNEL